MKIDELDAREGASDRPDGTVCLVCGDVATGRHYGAIACNGCKGFFRRTIRRGYSYECRFESRCDISKHNRAVCRFCRYTRCINAGMREEQVQNERDVIGKRNRTNSATSNKGRPIPMKRRQSSEDGSPKRSSPDLETLANCEDPWSHPDLVVDELLKSESTIHNLTDTVIRQTGEVQYSTRPEQPYSPLTPGARTAQLNDVFRSLHSQLLLVIEWAKTLQPFCELSTDDQTCLLKHFAAQHVVLCLAYRSKGAPSDFLRLLNNSYIQRPKEATESDYFLRDCEKVMDQLVAPMRFLEMDDAEFVALKACILFNPVAKGLTSSSVMKVLDIRRKIFAGLESYVKKTKPQEKTRIGDLTFFILSPLNSLANSVSEDILVSKLSGRARLDVLMEELILVDADEQKVLSNGNGGVPSDSIDHPKSNPQMIHNNSYAMGAYPQETPSYRESLADTFDFDFPNSFSNINNVFDNSRSNSPVLGMMGAGSMMWGSLADSNDSYMPNGIGF